MPYPVFDRSRLKLRPLAERAHDMTLADVLPLDAPPPPFDDANLSEVARRIVQARQAGAPVILMMGAHVIKRGLSRFVIDLMERGVDHPRRHERRRGNPRFRAGPDRRDHRERGALHPEGQFGLWQETGRINDAALPGAREGLGLGEAVGPHDRRGAPSRTAT